MKTKNVFRLERERFHTLEFEQLFRLPQSGLKTALEGEFRAMGRKVSTKDGWLYSPGEVPVLLVAHMDTVHRQPVECICYSRDGTVMMSPQGIGGDDRAGVYMILCIIQDINCHVLFCEDEEVGGQGARRFCRRKARPEVNYIIELDRRGSNDAVFYSCCNPAFTDFICGFGFEEARGSFSDISVLAPHLGAASVNISAGYYQEHRTHEYVRLDQMAANAARVRDIILTPTGRFSYMDRPSGLRYYGAMGGNLSLWDMEEDAAQKPLMELPAAACLTIGNQVIENTGGYRMDRAGNIYFCLTEVAAAVLMEGIKASSGTGEAVKFNGRRAKTVRIVELDEAMELLRAG